jgi:hypothetical protein
VGGAAVAHRYVACYVATELGKLEASPRIENKTQYIVSRIMGCVRLIHAQPSPHTPPISPRSPRPLSPHAVLRPLHPKIHLGAPGAYSVISTGVSAICNAGSGYAVESRNQPSSSTSHRSATHLSSRSWVACNDETTSKCLIRTILLRVHKELLRYRASPRTGTEVSLTARTHHIKITAHDGACLMARPGTECWLGLISDRYYPLYFLVQVLFAPMFIYADNFYNGPVLTAFHALITMTLTQVRASLPLLARGSSRVLHMMVGACLLLLAVTLLLSAASKPMCCLETTWPLCIAPSRDTSRQGAFQAGHKVAISKLAAQMREDSPLETWTL